MKKIIIIVISLLVLALIVFKLSSNYKKINTNKDVSTDLAYVTVNVSPVSKMTIKSNLTLTGYMEAYSKIDIASEASGTITSLEAELGHQKSKGSIIATIDDKLKNLAVQKAQNLKVKLQKDLERNKNLFNGGSLTEQQLDEAQNSYNDAVIQLEQAEKELANATIKSPINGIITKKDIEQGEYVNIGSP